MTLFYSALGLLIFSLLFVSVIYFGSPPRSIQSPTDEVASQSLSAYLHALGAKGSGSVCWLGDPKKVFLNRILGTPESTWARWKEKRRFFSWSPDRSCFDKGVKAIVVLFPFLPEIYELPPEESAQLQREASEVLSQSGRAAKFFRHNVYFHLIGAGSLLVFSMEDPNSKILGTTENSAPGK